MSKPNPAGSAGTSPADEVSATKGPGVSFTVRVSETQHQAIEALARLDEVSVAELMRRFVADGLNQGLQPERVAEKLKQQQQNFELLQQELIR